MQPFIFGGYKRFLLSIKCLLLIHLTALIILSFFRLVLFFSASYQLSDEMSIMLIAQAFVRGIWFDNVIGCYILLLPLTIVSISALFSYYGKVLWKGINIYFSIFYFVVFLITTVNIPYFNYFFKIINSSISNWFGYVNTTAGMVFGEISYYPFFVVFLFSVGVFIWIMSIFIRRNQQQLQQQLPYKHIYERVFVVITMVVCIGLCLFGIRGRTGYNPIKVSAAYYCTDPFLNQLGINPVFNLLNSMLDDNRKENQHLSLISNEEAIENVQRLLGRKGMDGISPIAREVTPSDSLCRPNIVLIFMESMSAQLMKRFGQEKSLTPFLDSLYSQSLGFPHFYSSGIHTNHGLYSTLYSFPTIMKRNAMKGSVIPIYSGLPTVLKENGYQTMFFMTSESQYDNMNAFFRTNGFDEIFSQENYPTEKVVNGFGVQDDYLYEYALGQLNEKSKAEKPFFAVLLSVSNHPPYVIPPYFELRNENREDQIVEYADWAIRKFMTEAATQNWYKNTIFVLLGDHGKMVGNADCEMPQSYNHIPLMIYAAPGSLCSDRVFAKEEEALGGQVDVAATLLGILNVKYVQNNFGVDLRKEKRPCMFFTADNMIGARNDSYFYIYSPENKQEFLYVTENGRLRQTKNQIMRDSLKNYVFSMLQATENLTEQQLTTDKNHKNR
ncbi:MAG: sulfatase-like hydrolase/transferase [Odoribacter sp.]